MPIKTENKHRYPPNWREIRCEILKRAGDRCECCGVPNQSRRQSGWVPWTRDPATAEAWSATVGNRASRIVLTIAHLDQTPENNDPANLAALCQRCHLAHDADHNQRKARQTRRCGKALGDLFDAHL